ncbi:MAG: serine/threonine-protein kinase [Desulfomonilaceae bacterium]|nr:serine/threonine-protein kinase [Desulfomonilaceae bacterium]
MNARVKDQVAGRFRQRVFEPRVFGRYCLIDQISKGGMSDIYLAKTVGESGFQKPLVIKKLIPRYAAKPSFVKRFVNEAKTLARLNHSNIVQVLDMGIIDGEYYIALEYIEGRNVAHITSKAAKTGRSPSLEFVLHVVMELARGLAYSHRKKGETGENLMLVHQDINAFNVMVSYEAEVKIIDFGIARIFLDKQEVENLPVAGKLLYFSPEQLRKKPVDRRVDIYGTGVLMYEMLAGERLVEHQETVGDTVKAILEVNVAEKVAKSDKIGDELKPILSKAMAFDPADRYSWMEEMIQDLRGVIRKCGIDTDSSELAMYMKEQFHREILLDRRRMRKLSSHKLTGSVAVPVSTAALTLTPPSTLDRDVFSAPLTPASWPFDQQHESRDETFQIPHKTLTVPAGTIIFRQGDPGRDLYVIRTGRVKLSLAVGNVEQTVAVLQEGDFFGETALINEAHRSVSARTHEDSVLVCLDREIFAHLIHDDFAGSVIANLVEKLRDSRAHFEGVLLDDSLSRLIFALVFFQRRLNRRNGRDIDLTELRELFRLQDAELVKKYLTKLESLNILQTDDQAVRITNADTLENILGVLRGQGKFVLKL